jgi:hypothetical protein
MPAWAGGGSVGWLLLLASMVAVAQPGASRSADISQQADSPKSNGQFASPRPKAGPPHAKLLLVHEAKAANKAHIEVTGLSNDLLKELSRQKLDLEQWQQFFSIHVLTDKKSGLPAMLGEYRIDDGRILFQPRFPFRPGLSYRATFRLDALSLSASLPTVTLDFSLPAAPPARATNVEQVYPSRNVLPENQLKFYIHFSAPMSRGEAYQKIQLLDASGKEVADPFLELGEELWDRTAKRFTLFFDPGRVKRGLKPREEVGSPLQAGEAYTLLIDRSWTDAAGNPLRRSFRKSFRVAKRDETQPDPNRWKLTIPSAGTRSAIDIALDEALDHAMLGRVLVIKDASGHEVIGRIEIGGEETSWRFHPQHNWQQGAYSLVVESILEDLAGNSIGRPFEVDRLALDPNPLTFDVVVLPFEIRTSGSHR